MVALSRAFFRERFGFNFVDFFMDPLTRLENQLRFKIFAYEEIDDDTIIDDKVKEWLRVAKDVTSQAS